jgi:hypothetical protein
MAWQETMRWMYLTFLPLLVYPLLSLLIPWVHRALSLSLSLSLCSFSGTQELLHMRDRWGDRTNPLNPEPFQVPIPSIPSMSCMFLYSLNLILLLHPVSSEGEWHIPFWLVFWSSLDSYSYPFSESLDSLWDQFSLSSLSCMWGIVGDRTNPFRSPPTPSMSSFSYYTQWGSPTNMWTH